MRALASALLLAVVAASAAARAEQDQSLGQVISRLRACVQTNAPSARAIGMQTTADASNFFLGVCGPPPNDLGQIGAVPPGIFRRVVGEEWRAFVDAAVPR
jgi:hypothetical protein